MTYETPKITGSIGTGVLLNDRAKKGFSAPYPTRPKIDMEGIKKRLANGFSPTAIARDLGISRGTVYKAKAAM